VNTEGLIERCFHSKCMKMCMMGYSVLYRRASCISKLVYYFVVIMSLASCTEWYCAIMYALCRQGIGHEMCACPFFPFLNMVMWALHDAPFFTLPFYLSPCGDFTFDREPCRLISVFKSFVVFPSLGGV